MTRMELDRVHYAIWQSVRAIDTRDIRALIDQPIFEMESACDEIIFETLRMDFKNG